MQSNVNVKKTIIAWARKIIKSTYCTSNYLAHNANHYYTFSKISKGVCNLYLKDSVNKHFKEWSILV